MPPTQKSLPAEIKNHIDEMFERYNVLDPYILYEEEPDVPPVALLPGQRSLDRQDGWTVYLIFHESRPALEHLAKIIAFPDAREGEIPLRRAVTPDIANRFLLEQPELTQVPDEFVFNSLEELEQHLKRIR
jgi:hypothetical protein